MLFIIQQLAIIASKLIIRSSSMSAVHNSWLDPEISLLNPTSWMVPSFVQGPLIPTLGGRGGCSLCRHAAITCGVQGHREWVSVTFLPALLGSSERWVWWGSTSHTE